MILQELFQKLSYGELANLAVSGEGSGEIVPESQNRLASLINTALDELCARIPYKEGYVKIQTTSAQTSYTLLPEAAFLVEDAPGDFQDALLKVVAVNRLDDTETAEDESYSLSLNERNGWDVTKTIRVIGADTLYFPSPVEGAMYLVEYKAKPVKLTIPADDAEVVDIAPALEAALQFCVASKFYGGMNGEFATIRSRELMAMCNEALAIVDQKDLLAQTETDVFDKLRDRGFV